MDGKLVESLYEQQAEKRSTILKDLESIVKASNVALEGNSFYRHQSLTLYPALYNKQLNLFWCGTQAVTKICEIGFNAGHSSMLLLLGRTETPIEMTIFDIGHHPYTRPCRECIKTAFPHAVWEYIEGDSTVTMPVWIQDHKDQEGTYDVVHVDGGHSKHCIHHDMMNTDKLVKIGGLVIVDDTNCSHISRLVDTYIQSGRYEEVHVLPSSGYPHRVCRRIA